MKAALYLLFGLLALLPAAARAGAPFAVGLDYPWYQQNGEHFYGRLFGELTEAERAAIEAHLQDMQEVGISRLRIWLFGDGWRWPERVHGHFVPLSEAFLRDLTWFVRRAHAHGIRVQPSLWDFLVNRDHPEYLTDAAALPELIATVIAPLARALAPESGLDSFDVFNEPEWIIKDKGDEPAAAPPRPAGNQPPLPFAVVARFVHAHVDAVHAAGARASLGSASARWVARWKGFGLDEYQVHYYPRPGTAWMGNAQFRLLPAVAKLGLDRPCVLGEFPPNVKHTELGTVLSILRDKGYAGAWAWSFFGNGYPEDLAHPFSYRARRAEFRAFTSQAR